MVNLHRKYWLVVGLALLLGAISIVPAVAQREVTFTAQVDKTVLRTDDNLNLELILTGPFRNANKPDLPQMEDFYVLSNGQSSQFSLINGQMSSRIVYSYRLQPLRVGTLTIPSISITVGGETYNTEIIKVEATAGSAPAPQPDQPPAEDESNLEIPGELTGQNFYVEAEVDNDTPFVSQQVIYTFRLYQRINFSRSPSLDWPEFTGFLAYDLTPNKQYYQNAGDEQYLVTEVRRALFPTSTGPVVLDPTLLTVPGDIFNQGFLLQTNPVTIEVYPLPEGAPAGFNGAVGRYEIEAWTEPDTSRVNEPVSLFVRISGSGSINSLPDPTAETVADLPGWRAYDPRITTQTQQEGDVLQGEKVIERLLLPVDAGTLSIPAFSLVYFDPFSAIYRQVETTPLELEIDEGELEVPGVVLLGNGKQEIAVLGADIRHIKPAGPVLKMVQPSLIQRPLYWTGWVLPFSIFVGFAIWYRYRNNLDHDNTLLRRQKAFAAARRRLRELRTAQMEDTVYAGISQVLMQYVGDKFNLPPAGMTRDGIRKTLESRIPPQDLHNLLAYLDWADSGRFAPTAEGRQARDLANLALQLLEHIEKVLI
jgi:hypothetical protein